MKNRTALISLVIIVLIAGIIYYVRSKRTVKADSTEIVQFLNKFNNSINDGNTDTLTSCFQSYKGSKTLKRLIFLLGGQKTAVGLKPPVTIFFDIDKAVIKNAPDGSVLAVLPVIFSHESAAGKQSVLTLKIIKAQASQYKIIQTDARRFLNDYNEYLNSIKNETVPDRTVYSPITLNAFKTAGQLKARYDSVLWLDHVDDKTFFYVIKGTLNKDFFWGDADNKKAAPTYKMGLVNPDLKEIIPPEYDLVHNVGGTIEGLVEVEKDGKRGLYNLDGKLIAPVKYDQVFPLTDSVNIALLRQDDDYFYLKKDLGTTEKLAGFKITGILQKIKTLGDSYTLSDKSSKNLMEYNSRDETNSLIITPSYLVDLQILPQFIHFQNPLRKVPEEEEGDREGSVTLDVKFDAANKQETNWFQSIFYSVVDDYLGARSGLYETKKVLMVDKKRNRVLSFDADSYHGGAEGGGSLSGMCSENYLRAVNDTLLEFKTTANLDQILLNGQSLAEGPYFHYLHIVNGKLAALPCKRIFACTKFVKLDDSYFQSCFVVDKTSVGHMTPEILAYMKNEIYASYGYNFKNQKWVDVFAQRYGGEDRSKHDNVDDSLSVIEKYNVNWIVQKLKGVTAKPNALAAR